MKQKAKNKLFWLMFFVMFFFSFQNQNAWADDLVETQTSQAQFQAGTADANIDLTTSAGDAQLGTSVGYSVWADDGVAVISDGIDQSASSYFRKKSIVDDDGNSIVVFRDNRDGNYNIYAQKINSSGVVQWIAGGVTVVDDVNDQSLPTIISDGSDGAIIFWIDNRNGNNDIYAQKINASGVAQWADDGIPLVTESSSQQFIAPTADGNGGAIVMWTDLRNGNGDIYAQKINASGAVQWAADGVAICTEINDQTTHAFYEDFIVSDGAGGAIMTWSDERVDGSNGDIYAQRVNASGVAQWTAGGVPIVARAGEDQRDPSMIADGAGGAIIVWKDDRSGPWAIYGQKINSSGNVQWTADGVAINTAITETDFGPAEYMASLVSDGAGGVIAVWSDDRVSEDNEWDVYAQRIDSDGDVQWTANGVAIANSGDDELYPMATSNDSGGAVISWIRGAVDSYDVYAQEINASGVVQWTAGGVVVSGATEDQVLGQITYVGNNQSVVVWWDQRDGDYDIYAQKIGPTETYNSPGVLISSSVDAGSSVDWTTLQSEKTTPVNTSLTFETRTGSLVSADPTNLSLAATASASSSYFPVPGSGYTPDRANDGIAYTDGNSSAWLNDFTLGMPAWLEVDYGSEKTITDVDIYFVNAGGTDYLASNFKIQTWNGSGWDDQETVVGNASMNPTYTFSEAVTTQKLRIYITAAPAPGGVVAISELETYQGAYTSWSAWSATTGTTINSPNSQYLQYRATLSTTDTSATPVLSSVSVYKASDTPTPTPTPTEDDDDDDDDDDETTPTTPTTYSGSPVASITTPETTTVTTQTSQSSVSVPTPIQQASEKPAGQKEKTFLSNLMSQISPDYPITATISTLLSTLPLIPAITQIGTIFNLPIWIKELLLRIMGLLGIRKRKKQQWGTVFNLQTGEPISFARVDLLDLNTNRIKESKLTDNNGSYFFLAEKGSYQLIITKKGFKTDNLTTAANHFYTNAYKPQTTINLPETSIINQNIPLTQYETNQWEFLTKGIFLNVISLLFWIGFAINAILVLVYPTLLNSIIFTIYVFMASMKLTYVSKPKFGSIINKQGYPQAFSTIKVTNQQKELMARTITDEKGRYFMILNPGNYIINIFDMNNKNIYHKEVSFKNQEVFGENVVV